MQKRQYASPHEAHKPSTRTIWRRKVARLYRLRHGRDDHDGEEGRRFLKVLIALGLPVAEADEHVAPWIGTAELKWIARAAARMKVNPTTIGRDLRLTDQERERWPQMKSFRPCDVAWKVVQARRAAKRKASDRARRRRQRDELRARTGTIRSRQLALLALLKGRGAPVPVLVEKAMQARGLPKGPNGWRDPFRSDWQQRPDARTVRTLVHRELDRLEERELVKRSYRPGKRGPVRFAEIADHKAVADLMRGLRSLQRAEREELERWLVEVDGRWTEKCEPHSITPKKPAQVVQLFAFSALEGLSTSIEECRRPLLDTSPMLRRAENEQEGCPTTEFEEGDVLKPQVRGRQDGLAADGRGGSHVIVVPPVGIRWSEQEVRQ
jgi:hypothetical protein